MTMIKYATIKPIEEYNVTMPSGNVHGLHDSYGYNPALLALILIGTPLGYDYEGNKPPGSRQVIIKNIESLKESLNFKLGADTVRDLLKTLNPIEFYNFIGPYDLLELPLVKVAYLSDQKLFKHMVGARAAAWGMNYRGSVTTKGKITMASFGGHSSIGVSAGLQEMDRVMREEYANE